MRHALAFIAAVGLAGASTAAAADTSANEARIRKNVGIGLGTMLWSNVGDGLLPQICAATTNGSSGNQTFAVTTGTSEADKWDGIVSGKDLGEYIHGNVDAVARDAAAGRGESLDVLAELAAIPEAKRAAFAARLQAEIPAIFASAQADAAAVTRSVVAIAQSI